MGTEVASLVGRVAVEGVDSARAGLRGLGDDFQKAGGGAQGLSVAGVALGTVLGGVVASGFQFVTSAFSDSIQSTLAYTQQIGELSDKLGATTDQVARFAQAADDASVSARGIGLETGQVANALERFQSMLGKGMDGLDGLGARGALIKGTFAELGVSLSQVDADGQGSFDVLMQVADGISQVSNKAEQAAIAKRLGLSDLLPLLRQGREGVKAMMDEIDAGLVPTEQAIQAQKNLAKANDDLNDSIEVLKLSIGGALVPDLANLARSVANLTQSSGGFTDRVRIILNLLSRGIIPTAEEVQRQIDAINAANARSAAMWSDAYRDAPRQVDGARQSVEQLAKAQSDLTVEFYNTRPPDFKDYTEGLTRAKDAAEKDAAAAEFNRIAHEKLNKDMATELETRRQIALLSGAHKPLPTAPPGPAEQFAQVQDLKEKGPEQKKEFEAEIVGQMAARTAELTKNVGGASDVYTRYKANVIGVNEAYLELIKLGPQVGGVLSPFLNYMKGTEKMAGFEGEIADMSFKTIQVLVKGSKDAQVALQQNEVDRQRLKAKMATNIGSEQIWDDAGGKGPNARPKNATPEMMKLERDQIDLALAKLEKEAPELKKKATDHYVSVLVPDVPAIQAAIAKSGDPLDAITRSLMAGNKVGAPRETTDALDRREGERGKAEAGGDIASAVGTGIVDGFIAQEVLVTEAMVLMMTRAHDATLDYLEARSPSQLMARDAGAPMALGVAQGVTDNSQLVVLAISAVVAESAAVWTDKAATTVWTDAGRFIMQTLADSIRTNGGLVRLALQDAVQGNANWLKQQVFNWVNQMLRGG